MPCYYSSVNDHNSEERFRLGARANAATRAACEMARVIRNAPITLWSRLSLSTQKWIRAHEALDARREVVRMATKKTAKKPSKTGKRGL